ncbi:hypothetical protein [Parafrankia sp. EUN1f]|uniref:hypothetical protein n=1 Tax=Parafrankia sp. EUN1f TaxID=102897 RepID=UPI001E54364E|nr:hypothetical protein [Parafrankia sp. EUN1f]
MQETVWKRLGKVVVPPALCIQQGEERGTGQRPQVGPGWQVVAVMTAVAASHPQAKITTYLEGVAQAMRHNSLAFYTDMGGYAPTVKIYGRNTTGRRILRRTR